MELTLSHVSQEFLGRRAPPRPARAATGWPGRALPCQDLGVLQGGSNKMNIEGCSEVGLFLSSSGRGSIRMLGHVSPGCVEILIWGTAACFSHGARPDVGRVGLISTPEIPETSEDDSRVEFLLRTWSRCLCHAIVAEGVHVHKNLWWSCVEEPVRLKLSLCSCARFMPGIATGLERWIGTASHRHGICVEAGKLTDFKLHKVSWR